MAQCVVVADDLTGGNATGVLLARMGYRSHTVLNGAGLEPSALRDCDCVIFPTDSRAASPDEAADRVRKAAELLMGEDVKLYSKRIDSTLRGNLGSETDAMLDCLGEDFIAVSAPCFPSSGRTLVGGYLLVDGLPLHKTNIAIDPKTPVKTSDMAKLFREQSRHKVASIPLSGLMNGKHRLADEINALADAGSRIIIIDCVTDDDLNLIADAVITSGRKVLAVDPGAFTATLARKRVTPYARRERRKILAVVGSVNPNTTAQMEDLWLAQHPIANVFVETRRLLESEGEREAEIARAAAAALDKAPLNTVVTVTGDGLYPENRIDFAPYMERDGCSLDEATGRINNSLAEAARRILEAEPLFRGLYVSGGDVTQAVCRKFGASGLELQDEVLPLAAYGLLRGGAFDGLHIVTKGGSQGGANAINLCVNYLKGKLFI
ncbi:MAG: four-carbon acid sugar kinase family protein [Fretibacterium sp.]|nr:four-carbon acid sugar kinase family protein [Fretibacterium sp.]